MCGGVVGEWWTLLILRDAFGGTRGRPGPGSNQPTAAGAGE
jgi:hypothetical protein